MRVFRQFIISLSLVSLVPFSSQAWEKIIDCADGQVVVDTYSPRGQVDFYQIVIRNPELVQELKSSQAVFFYRINKEGELIIPLSRAGDDTWIFFGEHDANRIDGRFYQVIAKNGEISFEAFVSKQVSSEKYQVLDNLISLGIKHCRW